MRSTTESGGHRYSVGKGFPAGAKDLLPIDAVPEDYLTVTCDVDYAAVGVATRQRESYERSFAKLKGDHAQYLRRLRDLEARRDEFKQLEKPFNEAEIHLVEADIASVERGMASAADGFKQECEKLNKAVVRYMVVRLDSIGDYSAFDKDIDCICVEVPLLPEKTYDLRI